MDVQDNPYMNLVEIMQKEGRVHNPIPYIKGKVVSTSPFLVEANSIPIEREEMLINESLLASPNIEDCFKVGDRVVLLSEDQQEFILLCKVR